MPLMVKKIFTKQALSILVITGLLFHASTLQADQESAPLELSLASWTRDGEVMFAAILRDMTERRGIEQRMNTLASFSEHNPNPVLGVAPDGSTTYVNAAARERFPDLERLGLDHPILVGITDLLVTLRGEGTRSHVREVTIGGRRLRSATARSSATWSG